MFGMGECLKLADLLGVQAGKGRFLHGPAEDAREELRLGAKIFRAQSGGFTGSLNGGEIDVRGQILFAGMREQIVADAMAVIGAQRAARAGGGNHLRIGEAVINGEQLAVLQIAGGLTPPVLGGGTGFNRVAIGQDVQERSVKVEDGSGQRIA